eukprot:TRINITY_DN615_c0_g1_i2.p2 TRINITY_DN615_c0_g1~~TRINITY_DN615_c0_g1_i2.p2  ORF type:complete len:169 (+),score=44.32 TRINITY_DN615_c0_g1_i2:775-1281(+)
MHQHSEFLHCKTARMRSSNIMSVSAHNCQQMTASAPHLLLPSRAGRRAAQVKEEKGKKKGKRSKKGGALAAVEAEPATSQPQAAAVTPENESSSTDESKPGSMLDGWKQALKDVNQQSYAQALAMNSVLEEKGILPPLQRPQEQEGEENLKDSAAKAGADQEAQESKP